MSARAAARPLTGLVLGGEPRVNLLPPEVAERSRQRGVRVRLALLVILAGLLVGAGYGYAVWRTVSAEATLAAEQARSAALIAEQQTYVEVSTMNNLVLGSTLAQQVAVSGEVVWADVVEEISDQAQIPILAIDYSVAGRPPWDPYLTPTGPLREPRVATISFRFLSASVVDVTSFQKRIEALDVVADSTVDSVEAVEGGFITTVVVNLDTQALTDRFATEEKQ